MREKTHFVHFEISYKSEIQTPKLDELSSEKQIKRETYQGMDMDSLNTKHLEKQALRDLF